MKFNFITRILLIFVLTLNSLVANAIQVGSGVSEDEPSTGLPSGRNNMPDFNMKDLLTTSIKGMLGSDCGGYCVIGACAHFRVRFTWNGVRFYTIISPKLRHAVPDLLISSYNHVGTEPWSEWRQSFGLAMTTVNQGVVAPILGTPFGLQGGRADHIEQDQHQSVSYKEVDIIGHPAAIIPHIITTNGDIDDSLSFNYQVPWVNSFPEASDLDGSENDPDGDGNDDWDIAAMLDSGFAQILETIKAQILAALMAIEIIALIQNILDLAETLQQLLEFYDQAMLLAESITRGTFYANFVNPVFRATRLFCPSNVAPFQPYYLSYADTFFWRSGYPITDGPISGSDHSLEVMNPFTSPSLGNGIEEWGSMYPREGTVNNNHDAKTASVVAWRALDVLMKDVKNGSGGYRVGVPLPDNYERMYDSGQGLWQMIYPELKSCQATPFYETTDVTKDFMEPNEFGGYAWNYYNQYECCMNTSGTKIGEIDFPAPLCLSLD